MSVVYTSCDGTLLCHEKYLNDLLQRYGDVCTAVESDLSIQDIVTSICDTKNKKSFETEGTKNTSNKFQVKELIFDVKVPFMKEDEAKARCRFVKENPNSDLFLWEKKKRKVSDSFSSYNFTLMESTKHILQMTRELITEGRKCNYFTYQPTHEDIEANNRILREFVNTFHKHNLWEDLRNLKVHEYNNTNSWTIKKISGSDFMIPPQSEYYCSDIMNVSQLLGETEHFGLIVIDPPWTSKSLRLRKKSTTEKSSYSDGTLSYDVLAMIPIRSLAAQGALVAVWCTNNAAHLTHLKEVLFPLWGIKYCTQWYWVKVTKSGYPILPFTYGFGNKKPWEMLLLGRVLGDSPTEDVSPPCNHVFVSVPSGIHSHKPPLFDILQPYVPAGLRNLDLFARYLSPNCVSYGNQVLALQHLSLFHRLQGGC